MLPRAPARLAAAHNRSTVGGRQMSAERAAIVTGASSGIGLAIARVLGEEGYGADDGRPPPREARGRRGRARRRAASTCTGSRRTSPRRRRSRRSSTPTASATDGWTCSSTTPVSASARRSAEIETKHLDMQLDINLRSIILFYRECIDMLAQAAARARQRARRQHLLDLRQARRGRGCRSTRRPSTAWSAGPRR